MDKKTKNEIKIESSVSNFLTIPRAYIYVFLPEYICHITCSSYLQNYRKAMYIPFKLNTMEIQIF